MTSEANERRDLDLTGITSAEIATFNGDIQVETGATQARLEANIRGNATYKIEQLGAFLYIVGKKQGSSYANSGVTLRLWLPADLALKLATVSGDIQLKGSVSRLEASTSKGAIKTQATGNADIRLASSHGALKLHGARGTLKLVTSHGEIQLEQATGQIQAITSNGGIHLDKVAGQVQATTSNGEIHLDGGDGQMRLITSNGEVRIAQATGQIQAITSNGNMRLDHVSFAAGSKNWVKTSNGAVEIRDLSAPGGIQLFAKGHRNAMHADLSGYAIQLERDQLRASLPGANPAQLEIVTTKKISITTREM